MNSIIVFGSESEGDIRYDVNALTARLTGYLKAHFIVLE